MIYVIGSLRNARVPEVANALRAAGHEVIDDWWSASEDADEWWQAHEEMKGRPYAEALRGHHAKAVFDMDKSLLDLSNVAVLLMPAGKSGHLEFGYMLGQGKRGYVLFDEQPSRWDVMYRFANAVVFSVEELVEALNVGH